MKNKMQLTALNFQEILSSRDLAAIKDSALSHYQDRDPNKAGADNFLAECYFIAVMTYVSSKGYEILKKEDSGGN